MTQEFKSKLLDYITGNLDIEEGINQPIIKEDNGISESSHSAFINNMLVDSGYYTGSTSGDVIPAGFDIIGTLQFTNTDKTIIYGNMYLVSGSKPRQGALIIVDENNKYIAYISEFSTGTKFNAFSTLNIDETNLIYGVDYDSNYKSRFVLLNDIISSYLTYSEYKCILRKSYYFPDDYTSNNVILSIFKTHKEYSSANYLFIGETYASNKYTPIVITVDVNVGEQNEWNKYTTNDEINSGDTIESFCNWQNDTLQLKFGCTNAYNEYYFEFNFDGTTLTRTKSISCAGITSIEMTSMDNTYIVNEFYRDENSVINFYKVNGTSLDIIYTETIENPNAYSPTIETFTINGLLFGLISCPYDSSYIDRIYLIVDTEIYFIDIENTYSIKELFVKNVFNLYKIYYSGYDPNSISMKKKTYVSSSSLDYNPINYNGETYSNYNSLIPHKGTLFNNDNLIFSRNIYNKTILNNSTISTIQVPNSMLNSVTIENKKLVSETNLNIDDDENSITKNIYEMLLINFINTLNVIDEDTTTRYSQIANYINENINIGTQTNYNNSYIGKIRLNKANMETKSIQWVNIDETHLMAEISLYIDEIMESIDFISNDETTTYLTIDTSNMEVGKTYTIKQYLRME